MIVAATLLPLFGAAISFVVALLTLLMPSERSHESVFLGLLNLCTGLWLLGYTVEQNLRVWFAEGTLAFEQVAIFWFVIVSFASAGVALYWFLFAMEHAGYRRWTTGPALWIQHGIAFVIALGYATSPVQSLLYRGYVPGELTHSAGPLQLLADGVLFAWSIAALVVFLASAIRNPAPQLRRWGYVVAALGVIVFGGNLAWTLSDPFGLSLTVNPGLMVMPVLNAAVAYYVFRLGLLEFMPVSANAAFRNLEDVVVVADYSGHIVSANPAASRAFPQVAETSSIVVLLGRAGLDAVGYETWDRDSGHSLEFETVADERPYWVRVTPMPGRYRWQRGTLVLATEISRLRGAEREVREVNRRLVEAQATRERFLRNVGRELRSPLETVIGLSGVLLEELPGPLNDEQRSQLALVQDSGNRLLQILDRILNLAAAKDEDLGIDYAEADVCVVAQDVIRGLRPTATRKSLEILYKSNETACRVRTDIRYVRRILDNLVSNAVQYTDTGLVTVTVVGSESTVEIDVADTGRGISAPLQERVFEEFGQGEYTDPASPDEGAHIGLALSRQLARRLGGDITLASTPGIGSRFRFSMPRIEP